jgi:hypothetical protein
VSSFLQDRLCWRLKLTLLAALLGAAIPRLALTPATPDGYFQKVMAGKVKAMESSRDNLVMVTPCPEWRGGDTQERGAGDLKSPSDDMRTTSVIISTACG